MGEAGKASQIWPNQFYTPPRKPKKLPDGFVCHMEGRTYGSVSLTGPSGKTWTVQLIKQENDLFLHHGWSTFVVDHQLECGELLVFRYEGHLHFTVQVFDKDACEKEAAFHSECSQSSKIMSTNENQELELGVGKELLRYEIVRPIKKTKKPPKHVQLMMSLCLFTWTIAKKMKNIPYQFSMAHLPNCKIKIILHNLKGEHWTVNSVPTTRVHTSHTLCGGWMAFVRGNNIKVGDICIFELVHECELRVRIAEVAKDGSDCQVGNLAITRPSAGHAVTSRCMPMNPKVNSKCIRKVDLSDKKWSKIGQETILSIDLKKSSRASNTSKKMGLCPQSKAAHKKLAAPRRHRVDDELSSQAKAGLRMLFALDEQRVAQAFTSPFPSFVKIMKKFNVSGSYTLKIPYQFSAAHLPTYKTEVTLRNSRGECWTVNSVPDAKGRTVHTFCGGWMAFVRDNDINFGDTCIFELVAQCEMHVYISGVGKEGLDHQNGHLKLTNRLANVPSTC
ncbi:B3 domain-containing protein [Glycine soja]